MRGVVEFLVRTMRAQMTAVPAELLAWRKKTGADRWDEVWDGVLHMSFNPGACHQEVEGALFVWLHTHWGNAPGRDVLCRIDISPPGLEDWTTNYRTPDIVLVTPERASRLASGHLVGGPDVAIEVRSPGDESYDKLDFYCQVGTDEIWVIDRATLACEIYKNRDGAPVRDDEPRDGWSVSQLGIEMKTVERRLAIRLVGDTASEVLLP